MLRKIHPHLTNQTGKTDGYVIVKETRKIIVSSFRFNKSKGTKSLSIFLNRECENYILRTPPTVFFGHRFYNTTLRNPYYELSPTSNNLTDIYLNV